MFVPEEHVSYFRSDTVFFNGAGWVLLEEKSQASSDVKRRPWI